uniref:Methyltransferase n=1 Tax=viral metagenome TaxID=1070528 RepID=A0A6C0J4G1_9ZZZZ
MLNKGGKMVIVNETEKGISELRKLYRTERAQEHLFSDKFYFFVLKCQYDSYVIPGKIDLTKGFYDMMYFFLLGEPM